MDTTRSGATAQPFAPLLGPAALQASVDLDLDVILTSTGAAREAAAALVELAAASAPPFDRATDA